MRHPRQLPDELHGRIFTRADALAAGLSPERLRRRDIERIARGRYRWLGRPRPGPGIPPEPDFPGSEPRVDNSTVHEVLPRAADVLDAVPDACASHTTTAILRGWWLPDTLWRAATVHVIRPETRPRLSRQNVVTHRTAVRDADVVRVHGRRVTAVDRTWLDCASLMNIEDLVVLGDILVRIPHSWVESGSEPWTTLQALRDCVGRYPGTTGVSKARKALTLIRVGSDSPQESRLRLAMNAARLPEPSLQVECWDPEYSADFPATADLGYPEWKIAIQYEGNHHGGQAQLGRDLRRDQAFLRQGWSVLRFGSADSLEGFRTAVQLITQAIRTAQERSAIPSSA